MATNYGSADVKCAFYQSESDKAIKCEGIENTQQMVLEFQTKQDKIGWKEERCNKICPDCPIKELIEKKYQ